MMVERQVLLLLLLILFSGVRKDSEAANKQRWSLVVVFLVVVEIVALFNFFIGLLIAFAIIIDAIILIRIKLGSLCSLLLVLLMFYGFYGNRKGLLHSRRYWRHS